MVTISNKHKLGDWVYVMHDAGYKRMVVGLEVYLDGSFLYKLAGDGKEGYYNEREIISADLYCKSE